MELFFEFLATQWVLVAALLVCFALLFFHENRRGGATLSPQELVNLVNREQAVVVDIRDSKDYKGGHIVESLNMPFARLAERGDELPKDKPLVLVCKMGSHSGAAGKLLAKQGFENIYRLRGGMLEWKASQLPMVKS